MTPKELHDELKRLAEKASQGEWRIYRQECPTYDDVVSELLQLFALTKPTIPALIMLEAGGKCPATTGCGPTSEANAGLIAALRNNLPTLLRALSALEALEGVKGALEAHDAFWQRVREHEGQCTENDFWDWSLELGLMRTEPYDPAKHGENDCDLETGDDWHLSTNLARSALSQLEAAGK